MRCTTREPSRLLHLGLAFICGLSLILWVGCGDRSGRSSTPAPVVRDGRLPSKGDPMLRAALAVQERHTAALIQRGDVVGTGTGLDAQGRPAVVIFARETVPEKLEGFPGFLDGVPVVVRATGPFFRGKRGGKKGGGRVDPRVRFARPVPIGVSSGSAESAVTGTLGCRLTDGTDVYALSNNHIYGLDNVAPLGSGVVQPGLFDQSPSDITANIIGTLFDFQVTEFSDTANNTIDAAVALTSTSELSNATPSDGYGVPSSTPVAASLGLSVKKYGRTTRQTTGRISAINVTVLTTDTTGDALFVDQIFIDGKKAFGKAGDSGSLVVTQSGNNPVGLYFAGDNSGKLGIANRIDLVLQTFNMTVDGN